MLKMLLLLIQSGLVLVTAGDCDFEFVVFDGGIAVKLVDMCCDSSVVVLEDVNDESCFGDEKLGGRRREMV